MKSIGTRQELIDVLDEADMPKQTKRSIYFSIVNGTDFARHNGEALKRNARKFPCFSIVLPDGTGLAISGELRKAMIREAKSKVI